MTHTIICDIDGTLADIEHRRHYVRSKPKNWGAFNKAMHLDGFHEDIGRLVRTLWRLTEDDRGLGNARVFLVSGRGEENRDKTVEWLLKNKIYPENHDSKYVFPEFPLFTYEKLYMRPEKDYRPDTEIKREILTHMILNDGVDPNRTMAIDDRDSVVTMWREAGIRCLQVAAGDF